MEAVTSPAGSVVRLGRDSRVLRGMAYGLSQPVMVVGLRISRAVRGPFEDLDRAMLEFIRTPFADDVQGAGGDVRALALRVHHWHVAMQREADVPVFGPCTVGASSPAATSEDGMEHLVLALPCRRREATEAALRWVVDAVDVLLGCAAQAAQLEPLRVAFAAAGRVLRTAAVQGVNAIHFLAAAHRLSLPVTELAGGLHCIGQGRHARRLDSSVTDETGLLAAGLAQDKANTALVLRKLGFPVPRHRLVRSEAEAVASASAIGYPVVVKPADRDGGVGVFAGLSREDVLRSSYREACRMSRRVLVEKHFEGEDYRFTVVRGAVVKIMHRRPGGVTGDGQADVAALVERVKASEPHRRAFRRQGTWRLSLDREATELLAEQGLDAASVPEAGRFVRLRRKSNISSGGEHALVPLDAVHPDNADLAIRAARAIGLDIAGIDLILPDAARAWHDAGGIICEVNAKPQIGLRDTPEIYADILRGMVHGDGTVPVHLLVLPDDGVGDRPSPAATLARQLGCNARSSAAGAWVDDRQTIWRPRDSFAAAQAMLLDDRVAAALACMTARDVFHFGLPSARLAGALLTPQAARQLSDGGMARLAGMLKGHGGEIRLLGGRG